MVEKQEQPTGESPEAGVGAGKVGGAFGGVGEQQKGREQQQPTSGNAPRQSEEGALAIAGVDFAGGQEQKTAY